MTRNYRRICTATRPANFLLVFLTLVLFSCSHTTPYYANDADRPAGLEIELEQVRQRVLIIGDAGGPLHGGEPVLHQLEEWAAQAPQKTTVLFLGDNIYPDGLVHPDSAYYRDRVRRLEAQLEVVRGSGARGIFIPGNHDWDYSGPEGLASVIRQADYVRQSLNDPRSFLPDPGCPGPEVVDLDGVRLIVLDSEWWLFNYEKKSAECANADTAAVLRALDEAIAGAGEREVIIAAHHPIESKGPHGGFFEWDDHLFPLRKINKRLWIPLPIIGSMYPLGRRYIVRSNQDLFGPENTRMREGFKRVFSRHAPLFYTSGHDHSLQVFDGGADIGYYLLSGAGSSAKISAAGHNGKTLFSYAHEGFMVFDLMADGRKFLRVVTPEAEPVKFEHIMR